MGLLDPPGLSLASGDARYIPAKRLAIATLLAQLSPATTPAVPAISTDAPTVTTSTTSTVSGRSVGIQTGEITEIGSRSTFDSSTNRMPASGLSGIDFFLTDTTCEISFFTGTVTQAYPMWIWVDGAPVTATPDTSAGTLTGSTRYFVKLVWGTSKRRRIEFFIPGISGWYGVNCTITGLITPSPRKPVVAFIGDSFFAGSAGTQVLQSAAFLMSRMLGVECYMQALGGTGFIAVGVYTSTQTFGGTARVAQTAAGNPVAAIMSGSVNDGATGLQTAATSAFAAYATAVPNMPIVVFGPQPSNAVDTISTGRAAAIAAVKAAAIASSNVIAFRDMVGSNSGTPPAVWASGSTYNPGDLVTYLGSVWQWASTAAGNATSPGISSRWKLTTYIYTGTGKVGTTTGDGNRDIMQYSDGVHPTPEASAALAIRQSSEFRAILAQYTAAGAVTQFAA